MVQEVYVMWDLSCSLLHGSRMLCETFPVLYCMAWLKNFLCYMIHGSNIVSYYVMHWQGRSCRVLGAQLSGISSYLESRYLTDRGAAQLSTSRIMCFMFISCSCGSHVCPLFLTLEILTHVPMDVDWTQLIKIVPDLICLVTSRFPKLFYCERSIL